MSPAMIPAGTSKVTRIACLLVALAACACTHVVENQQTDFDPATYPTFAFYPRMPDHPGDQGALTSRIRVSVSEALWDKGYRPAAAEQASFLVSLYTNLAGPLDPSALGYSVDTWETRDTQRNFRPTSDFDRWETGTTYDREQYINMLVVVDAVDAEAGKLIWRGWARNKTPPAAISLAELADVAATVLEEFPERTPL